MRKLSELIKLDKYTNKIQEPSLMLMTRNLDVIGKISKYTNWSTSFVGNGLDEISFEVHKYSDGKLCPVWNDLIDLKIINVDDYKNFEIQVEYTDSTETIKSVHGVSLETELGQLYLYDFHVNDEEVTGAIITEYNKDDFDENGKFIPTVLCNFDDPKHSLLHRVLKDKAPHWSIGEVTGYVSLSEDDKAELTKKFQRTYTVDGETIYDFLTGTVAKESNVIFVFDTIERKINCYSLCDCYVTEGDTKKKVGITIGEDTKVLVSKKKLANEISISSNKDSVKNCFRIEGGDDVITDMVRAVNMNGSNYIYQFADFQYNDMPPVLVDAIKDYQTEMSKQDVKDSYYGENGIFTRLCEAYEELSYLESEMMPAIEIEYPKTAKEQYELLKQELELMVIGVVSMKNYDSSAFVGVTNNVEAMANIIIDSRYSLEVIPGTTSYTYDENAEKAEWTGTIQVTRVSNETDYYPIPVNNVFSETITVEISDDKTDSSLPYTRQKIDKALAKGDMGLVDYDADQLDTEEEIYDYFNQYCLNRLSAFKDGYNSCLSTLMSVDVTSEIKDELYEEYHKKYTIVEKVYNERYIEINGNEEIVGVKNEIDNILKEQAAFQEKYDFVAWLEKYEAGLYNKFCMYRREDTYSNNNYISDNMNTTADIINKARELVQVAEKEIKKACVLQRTVSCSLNNLFAMTEFEPLYDSFDLFNYIRIQTDDEILKLRLIGVDISGDTLSDIDVTFSEQIETVDGNMTDLESIIQQASSIASTYSSTALQAKQGSEAKNTFLDIYNNGLNAANMMLKNSDNNEVTMTSSGILCKRMDDEGFYGEKQLRIIGNGIYMTEDNWKSLSMAVGEINFNGKDMYGIIAEAIIGEMIVGNNLIIGNDNNVIINEDGITIYDSKYTEETAKKVFYADDKGNLNLSGYIYAQGGTFDGDITSTATITGGKIVGSEITNGDNFYVDSDGNVKCSNADISGKITATDGQIANFYISNDALHTDNASFDNTTGLYFGTDGLRIGSGFKIDKDGNLTSIGSINFANGLLSYNSTDGMQIKGNLTVYDDIYIYSTYSRNLFKFVTYDVETGNGVIKFLDHYGEVFLKAVSGETNTFYGSITGNAASANTSLQANNATNATYAKQITCADSTYKVGIGTMAYDGYNVAYINTKSQNASGSYYITVNGLWQSSTYASHNIVSASSDVRLKYDIKDSDINALEMIEKIKIRQFKWKNGNAHQPIGFIADELEELDSRLSVGGEDDKEGNPNYKCVDGYYLQGYEVKAIQELYQIIKLQQKEIKELKQMITQ